MGLRGFTYTEFLMVLEYGYEEEAEAKSSLLIQICTNQWCSDKCLTSSPESKTKP
jgi:hypothetical protein